MKKKQLNMPTVKELKAKAPLADIYKLTPNARYLIIYKQGRIIQMDTSAARRQVDNLVMALTGLDLRAVGLIFDDSENLSVIELTNL